MKEYLEQQLRNKRGKFKLHCELPTEDGVYSIYHIMNSPGILSFKRIDNWIDDGDNYILYAKIGKPLTSSNLKSVISKKDVLEVFHNEYREHRLKGLLDE